MTNFAEKNIFLAFAPSEKSRTPCTLANFDARGRTADGSSEPDFQIHESVLVDEVLAALEVHDGMLVVDATAGQGGHAEAILKAANVRLLALDADPGAVRLARERLAAFGSAEVVEQNFRDIAAVLASRGIAHADRVLFDLGWNRGQLASGRGFSFQTDEPLNMSYGSEPVSGFTAADVVNTWSEEAISNALFGYGSERYARRIARAIAEHRRQHAIDSTQHLVGVIGSAVPAGYRRGRLHFATKTFQALRMAVNDELGSIERGLKAAWRVLAPQGRIAVITFHSVEDGLVKNIFATFARDGGELGTKKPVVPSREEIMRNSAARSAKLRTIIKR